MEGKNVVFTGGCGNLGSVMVKVLLEYGASVAVLARADRLDESYAPYRNSNKLVVIQTDLSRTDSTKSSFAAAAEAFGGIDVLVNCAAYGVAVLAARTANIVWSFFRTKHGKKKSMAH